MGVSVAPAGAAPSRLRRPLLVLGAVGGVAAAAVSSAVALDGADADEGLVALARVCITAVPVAVALYSLARRTHQRFAVLLLVSALGWFVTTLAESDDEVVYTLGRLAGWLVQVLFLHLILSFPSGRLTSRADRLIVAGIAAAVAVLWLPRLAIAEDFELPSPYTSCLHGCPANAVFVLDREPGFVDAVLQPAAAVVVLALAAAAVVRLQQRLVHANRLTRVTVAPVLFVSAAFAALLALGFGTRALDRDASVVEVVSWILAFALPAVSVAVLVGLLRWRLFAGRALERLAHCLRSAPDATALRRGFADALEDPTIELAFVSDRGAPSFTDAAGWPVDLPVDDPGRSVSEIRHDGGLVAALVHDRALARDRALITAATAMAGVVLESLRLETEARVALREIDRSRARLAASAEHERRRIERELHDGAGQRLAALRIQLTLAEDVARERPAEAATRLEALGDEVDRALEELRMIGHGVYPSLLSDRGLVDALRAATGKFPIAVELDSRDVGRYPPEVESAVYFCVVEAVQDALEEARAAHRVVILLQAEADGKLRFSVRDDGTGIPVGTLQQGFGLVRAQDRVAAVGGQLETVNTPRVGTLVRGWVPTPP